MGDFFLVVFGLVMMVVMIYIFIWEFQNAAEEGRSDEKLKKTSGYNKNISGEIKNICRECGKTWFYDQGKINTLTESVLAGRHASRTAARAMGANIAYGQGNTLLNQSVLRSTQLNNISGQTTAAELESLRKCPNCNSNNVKRTQASSRTSSKSNISDLPQLNNNINIEDKLKKMKYLYDNKLIDNSDYKQMKIKLLNEMNYSEEEVSKINKPESSAFHCPDCNYKAKNHAARCPNCMGTNFGR